MKNYIRKNEIGITLVALVITIIILLILAGISIATLTGSGLFEKARLAEQESKNAQEKQEAILGDYENRISEYVDGTRNKIALTDEEYAMFRSQFSNNENITKVSINKPNTWTEGIEYSFGDRIYGQRFIGSIASTSETWTTMITMADDINIIETGGFIGLDGGATKNNFPFANKQVQFALLQYRTATKELVLGTMYSGGSAPITYDVWATYTK